jgi:hypothetical protein
MFRKVATRTGLVGLALVVGAVGLGACSSSDNSGTPSNTAGKSGTAGTGGASSGAGAPGFGGTSSSAGATGVAGAATGGGATGTGPFACTAAPMANCNTWTTFAQSTTNSWGSGTFVGGITVFGKTLVRDTSTNDIHVTGTVDGYGYGFGLYFQSCGDLSAYTGVSFKLKGTTVAAGAAGTAGAGAGGAATGGAGTGGTGGTATGGAGAGGTATGGAGGAPAGGGTASTLTFQLQTNADYPWMPMPTALKGACTATIDPTNPFGECIAPNASVPILASDATPITVSFASLMGGKPSVTADPTQVVGIQWGFPWTGAATGNYTFDVTLSDLTLTGGPAPVSCAVAAGGAGGTGGGGGAAGSSGAAGSGGTAGSGGSGGTTAGGAGGASAGGAGGAGGAHTGGAGGTSGAGGTH